MLAAGWTSLEIAKLGVAAAVPVVVVWLGWLISRAARHLDEAQWSGRKLIEPRLELYAEMARPLNDLIVFFRAVGDFRESRRRGRLLDALQEGTSGGQLNHAFRHIFLRQPQSRYLIAQVEVYAQRQP